VESVSLLIVLRITGASIRDGYKVGEANSVDDNFVIIQEVTDNAELFCSC